MHSPAPQFGPDRATYRHWLDRETRAVIGPAFVLRTFRRKYGKPDRITRCAANRCTAYSWLSGFELQTVTVYR